MVTGLKKRESERGFLFLAVSMCAVLLAFGCKHLSEFLDSGDAFLGITGAFFAVCSLAIAVIVCHEILKSFIRKRKLHELSVPHSKSNNGNGSHSTQDSRTRQGDSKA